MNFHQLIRWDHACGSYIVGETMMLIVTGGGNEHPLASTEVYLSINFVSLINTSLAENAELRCIICNSLLHRAA